MITPGAKSRRGLSPVTGAGGGVREERGVRFGLLGPLQIHVDGEPIPVESPKLRALLAVLLFHRDQPVPSGTIQRALWGQNPPASANASLQNHVTRLRRLLGADGHTRVAAVRAGYLIRADDCELDAAAFTDLAGRAGRARAAADWAAVTSLTTDALALWRGEPLADGPIEVLRPFVRQLVEIHIEVLEAHFEAALYRSPDGSDGLVPRLTRAAGQYPLREVFHVQLMEALHRGGNRAEALEVFQQLRRSLVGELGIEPSARAQQMQRRILAADGPIALEVPAQSARAAIPIDLPVPAALSDGTSGSDTPAGTAAIAHAEGPPAVPAVPTAHPPAPPAHLPRDVSVFVGRDKELAELLCAVSADDNGSRVSGIVTVDGMPGVGKSAFALHAAHRLADQFPDGQVHLALRGHSPGAEPMAPVHALESLLRQLGVPPARIPADLDARAGLWRSQVAGRRLLMLFDDACNSGQIRPLLPGTGESLVLVTSRRRLFGLDDALPITLGVLSPDEAADLLVVRSGRPGLAAEDANVRELVRLCGQLPLAVHLLAARLRHHPDWQVTDLVSDLSAASDLLCALDAGDVSARAAFSLSYRDLSEDRQRLFRLMGLAPADDLDAYGIAALAGSGLPAARQALRELEEHHLVEEKMRGRYRMHDLIRDHARSLASADEPDRGTAALDRLLDYYLRTVTRANELLESSRWQAATPVPDDERPVPALTTADEATVWLTSERRTIHAVIAYAATHERPTHVVELAIAFHEFLRVSGRWNEATAVCQTGLAAANQTAFVRGAAELRLQSAAIHRPAGRYQQCMAEASVALKLFRSIEDLDGQARALYARGMLYRILGRYAEAEEDLVLSLRLHRGTENRAGQGHVLVERALLQQLTGQYQAAEGSLAEALVLYRAVGHLRGQANALTQYGDLHRRLGRYPAAERDHQQALELYRWAGNRIGQANTLTDLGTVRWITGNHAAAQRALTEAVTVYRELEAPLGLANALTYLACVRSATGDAERAAAHLDEALTRCRTVGSRMGEAFVLMYRGDLHRSVGRHVEALADLTKALTHFTDLDDRGGQAQAHNLLGALALDAADPPRALTHHGMALDIAEAIRGPLEQARALEGLGEAHCRAGRPETGIPLLLRSLALHEELGDADLVRVRARLAARGSAGEGL
jgi:DNA-binding SARP family transcriptional activator/tetratricopeptide (TPR) repeat protein